MSDVAELVVPSVRWHEEYGYELTERELATALTLGCRGVYLHGGPLKATVEFLERVRERAVRPLFAVAELGGGVGERFPGATALPPLAALDSSDLEAMRRAARITAREARAAGINWALAPSCAVPGNATAIDASRAFSGGDGDAGEASAEWVDACQAEGVVATPGPYPLMRSTAADAALDAGAGALLLATEHATDRAATAYARNSVRFEGVIAVQLDLVVHARQQDEEPLAIACLAAGCDLLLGVDDVSSVVGALRQAQSRGALQADAIYASCARVDQRAAWADAGSGAFALREPTLDDALWARRVADAAVHIQRGRVHALALPADLIIVDDDPPRSEGAGTALHETLRELGADVQRVAEPSAGSRGTVIVAMFGDRRLAIGFDAYSDGAVARARDCAARADRAARDVVVVHFTPPAYAEPLEGVANVVCAWSGTRAMEEAAARWLARG